MLYTKPLQSYVKQVVMTESLDQAVCFWNSGQFGADYFLCSIFQKIPKWITKSRNCKVHSGKHDHELPKCLTESLIHQRTHRHLPEVIATAALIDEVWSQCAAVVIRDPQARDRQLSKVDSNMPFLIGSLKLETAELGNCTQELIDASDKFKKQFLACSSRVTEGRSQRRLKEAKVRPMGSHLCHDVSSNVSIT